MANIMDTQLSTSGVKRKGDETNRDNQKVVRYDDIVNEPASDDTLLNYFVSVGVAFRKNELIHELLEVPLIKSARTNDKLWKLSEFVNHVTNVVPAPDLPTMQRILPDLTEQGHIVSRLIDLTRNPGPHNALYKHLLSLQIDAAQHQTLIDCLWDWSELTHLPRICWIDVCNNSGKFFPFPVKGFKLFEHSKSSNSRARYDLTMAILKSGVCGYCVVVKNKGDSGTWIKYTHDGETMIHVQGSIETLREIYSCAASVVYFTKDILHSESFTPGSQPYKLPFLESDVPTESSDDEEENLMHDLGDSSQNGSAKEGLSSYRMITPSQKDKIEQQLNRPTKYDALFLKASDFVNKKLAKELVSRQMPDDHSLELYKFLQRHGPVPFAFEGSEYDLRCRERSVGLALYNVSAQTSKALCMVCLQPVPAHAFVEFCVAHMDGKAEISVITAVSQKVTNFEVTVLRAHAKGYSSEKILGLMRTETKRVLSGQTVCNRQLFLDCFDLDESSLRTFSIFKQARSFQLASQLWSWIKMKVVDNQPGVFFSSKAIGIGSHLPLSDCDNFMTKCYFNNIVQSKNYSFQFNSSSLQQPSPSVMGFDRINVPWSLQNALRHSIYRILYEDLSRIYYGKSGDRSSAIARYHRKTLVESSSTMSRLTVQSMRTLEEGVYVVKRAEVMDILESCLQLAAYLAQVFNLPHKKCGQVLSVVNSGVEAGRNMSNMNYSYRNYLDHMLSDEFGMSLSYEVI